MQALGKPILTLEEGIKAKAFVQQNGEVLQVLRSSGDPAAALQAAPHSIKAARCVLALQTPPSRCCAAHGVAGVLSRTAQTVGC